MHGWRRLLSCDKRTCIFKHSTIKGTTKRRHMTQTQRDGTHDCLDMFFFHPFFPPANAAASRMMTNETWSHCRVAKSIIVFTLVMINHYLLGALNKSNKKAACNPHPSLGHRPVAIRLSSNGGSPWKKNTISRLYGLAIGDLRERIEWRKKKNTYMHTITRVHRLSSQAVALNI